MQDITQSPTVTREDGQSLYLAFVFFPAPHEVANPFLILGLSLMSFNLHAFPDSWLWEQISRTTGTC